MSDTCSYDSIIKDTEIRKIMDALDGESRKHASRLLSELYVKGEKLSISEAIVKYGSLGEARVRALYERELSLLKGR
ncbi:hypothetical protein HS1genome_1362 [Sulfodiicoccus acidiphilus]|uniref:Uncharacterized protein n=1 Tax=Sulfodiicoccus acidiphilus TaxID=1670455 RepID=A0A348B471_9CREN|nr:hypothetical protein [Sulfodiicoccus acidiphilus]BBD72973.1 hypothetical protein HS1genome_1362 [Sulfodiicoccus acidiphilus]GGT87617.1 hypothetical protein GCM10007116_01930 [Sulfodiicoccus acidiphilus]